MLEHRKVKRKSSLLKIYYYKYSFHYFLLFCMLSSRYVDEKSLVFLINFPSIGRWNLPMFGKYSSCFERRPILLLFSNFANVVTVTIYGGDWSVYARVHLCNLLHSFGNLISYLSAANGDGQQLSCRWS